MRRTTALFVFAFVCSTGVYSQEVAGFGAVTGTIRDSTGDGIPDSTVVVSNGNLGLRQKISTTDDGAFNAPGLVPGPGYSLQVTRKGFTNWEAKDFAVSLGQTLNFQIVLQEENSTKRVQTQEEALARVEDTKYGVSDLATRQQVDALPSDERRADPLVQLAPAVTQSGESGILAFRGERFTNAFLTDGELTTSTHELQEAGVARQLPLDAIEEIQVLSAGAPAEFGYSAGGIVNAATRSGTNGLHGTAYDYFNNGSWNATDRNAPGFRPGGGQQQGGASVGGSIVPSRLFWFSNFEVTDGRSEGLNRIANPLIGNPAGTAVLPSNCAAPATAAQCAAATNFLNAQMNVAVPRSLYSLAALAKFDYRPDENDSFSLEIEAMHRHAPNGAETAAVASNGELLGWNGSLGQETRFAKASWTRSLADGIAVNNMRAGYYRDRVSGYEDSKLLPATGALSIDLAGTPVGGNPAYPMARSEQHYQYADSLTLTLNSHLVKAGFEYSRNEDWIDQVFNRWGTYVYPSLTTFAEDFSGNTTSKKDYTNFTQRFGIPVIDLHMPEMAAYLQDSWRPSPRLTVNVGVRWEKPFVPQPTDKNAVYYQTASIPSPNKDFSPRLGVAYLLDRRTVVRAGFGTYFQPFPGQLLDALFTGNSIYQLSGALNPSQTGALVFPRVLASSTSLPNGAESVTYAIGGKFRNPYTEQAVVGIERSLGAGTTLTVSYVDSRGFGLWTAVDQNLNTTSTIKTYSIDNASGVKVGTFNTLVWLTKTNTAFAHAYQVNNEGGSRYHALAVQLLKRMSHGLTLQASYTWSHAIDDVSGAPIPGLGPIPSTTYVGDYRADQADSAFDQRHRAVVSWTWQPTLIKRNFAAGRYLLNGWQISGITTMASSLRETPLVLVNGQQFAGLTMAYTSSLNGSGGWQRAPFLGANSLLTGPQYDVDARLTRPLPITERVKAVLQFEAFNTLNMQFNTAVNTIAYTATSGVLRPVPGLGAGISSGGYPYGANARRAVVALRIEF